MVNRGSLTMFRSLHDSFVFLVLNYETLTCGAIRQPGEQQLAAPLPSVYMREVESGEGGLDFKALRHGEFWSQDHASAN